MEDPFAGRVSGPAPIDPLHTLRLAFGSFARGPAMTGAGTPCIPKLSARAGTAALPGLSPHDVFGTTHNFGMHGRGRGLATRPCAWGAGMVALGMFPGRIS